MISKWKSILTNWVNCYFDAEKEECLTTDTLLTVITHLHKNLSLDESTSSILEAQNIEEFLIEKYPEFKFENGTVEPKSEEEIYSVASLLLFFVCMNSKEVDIKQAMCYKLSQSDQETIMKFSSCLMESTHITFGDVQAAITEACGQEVAGCAISPELRQPVIQTPPALRSLHGEARRLQAALDAERFDRAYLQDEMTRASATIDKLLKDKEQYKLEIMELKAKISMCCGQESESREANAVSESSTRLVRQVQDLEERLIVTQEQLEDAQTERDVLKSKIGELKQERDKWFNVSQQESSRACQLADELDCERRRVGSLQELVSELRQYHRDNVLDGSQLECDDPDANVSLHNASVCSEACANVIEVQLSEERAKVASLKQQILNLQEHINDLSYKAETEKLSLEAVISQKEDDIFNLKHRVNEEIEEKNNIKLHYEYEFTKLNNDINELEQKLKENNESARATIEQRMSEVQTLQEEKLSLLQSLSDETTKLENIIKNLKTDIDTEKNLKVQMKEGYDNQLMKLNEKVLNRNNELVELQNKVFETGETMEQLNINLKKEKELYSELLNKYNHDIARLNGERNVVEHNLYQKTEEAKELQRRLLQNVAVFAELNKDIDDLKAIKGELEESNRILEEEKVALNCEIQQRDSDLEGIRKEIENITNIFSEEKDKFSKNVEERNETINSLQTRLRDEIQYKTELENELQNLHQSKFLLAEEVTKLGKDISMYQSEMQEKDRMIYALDLYLKEEKHLNKSLKAENENISEELKILNDEYLAKGKEVKELEEKLKSCTSNFSEEIRQRDEALEISKAQLSTEAEQKNVLEMTVEKLTKEKDALSGDLLMQSKELTKLQEEYVKLCQISDENIAAVQFLCKQIESETENYHLLESKFDDQSRKLLSKLNETEKAVKDMSSKSRITIEDKNLQIQSLRLANEKLSKDIEDEHENRLILIREKEVLVQKFEEEIIFKNTVKKEYQEQCAMTERLIAQYSDEVTKKSTEIINLKTEVESLMKIVCQKSEELKMWEVKVATEQNSIRDLTNQEELKNQEIKELKTRIEEMNALNCELKQEVEKEIAIKTQAIDALQQENEQLHFTIEEDNSTHEVIIKEKDKLIERLEERLKITKVQLESLRKEYESTTLIWEKQKLELREEIVNMDNEATKLHEQIITLKKDFEKSRIVAESNEHELQRQIQEAIKELNVKESTYSEHISLNKAEISQLSTQVTKLQTDNESLKKQLEFETIITDTLTDAKEKLSKEYEAIVEELHLEQSKISKCLFENNTLMNDKNILTQKVVEEKSLRELAEEEKKYLIAEKDKVQQQLAEEVSIRHRLHEEKECLLQQLTDEKSEKSIIYQEKQAIEGFKVSLEQKVKSLKQDVKLLQESKEYLEQQLKEEFQIRNNLEQERDYLIHEKNEFIEKKNQLEHQIAKEISSNKQLADRIDSLNNLLSEERLLNDEINIEKANLFEHNNVLKEDIKKLTAVQDILIHDKELLDVEKERLAISLIEEKAVRDELESEKNATSITLQELHEKYTNEIRNRDDQFSAVSAELRQMKTDAKKHEDVSICIMSVLDKGLERLMLNIKKEDIDNEVLHKLIGVSEDQLLTLRDKCDLLLNIADTLSTELSLRRNLEKTLEHESSAVREMENMVKEKEIQVMELQGEVKRLEQNVYENQVELSKQSENYNTTLDCKIKDIQSLKLENKSLNDELNSVKVQLEVKVHSLKEKLVDNENLTDKLKKTYEYQIENLNVMITKLTSYLKEKTTESDTLRRDKDKLQQIVDDNARVIKSLESDIKAQKVNQEKLISDFEAERQVIKNMVTVTESVMEDQKISLNKVIADHEKTIDTLQNEIKILKAEMETSRKKTEEVLQEKQLAFDVVFRDLAELRNDKETAERQLLSKNECLLKEITILKKESFAKASNTEYLEVQNKVLNKEKEELEHDIEIRTEKMQKEIEMLKEDLTQKVKEIEILEAQNEKLGTVADKLKDDLLCLQEKDSELKIKKDSLEFELLNRIEKLTKVLNDDTSKNDKFKFTLQERLESKTAIQDKVRVLTDEIIDLVKEKNEYISKLDDVRAEREFYEFRSKEEIAKLQEENSHLAAVIEENKTVIANLEQLIKQELEQNQKLRQEHRNDKFNMETRYGLLQEHQTKAEQLLLEKDKEIASLKVKISTDCNLNNVIENLKDDLAKKDTVISQIAEDKDGVINTLNKELLNEKSMREKYQKELENTATTVYELRQKLEEIKSETEVLDEMKRENDEMMRVVGLRETYAVASHDKGSNQKHSYVEKDLRDRLQVSTSTSDLTHSSIESLKTISDLEKIIHDKNRTITTLQSDITYMKSLLADSENKLLDITKELEMSKENCDQLSGQLKKIVHQKNEEIVELKKQLAKMSATENRATQIIKVSAKYQAIILKRIAEIKSNTILKELTNFGNNTNCDSELKRNLNSGAITMEDLENFLETTDRHLKRCTEKQIALQKERDRLTEVNRINESEIINMKKFLTEVSVGFKTFTSVKDLYTQKLSKVVSVQRTVRREILNLDGQVTDATMCKLERGYAAVMQDLSECVMNLERWVERSITRTISSEKIKQAFMSDMERQSLASTSFQNTSIEVQLEELQNSFQKLLEEVVRAQKGEGAKDPQSVTVMEVRAEYEDKLNRMKAKMKQLYQEQIQVFKDKQKEEISTLERELLKTRERLAESSRAYEEHIKALTTELWSVGEKFLMKKDEADWLRKKRSGSLMSLQHVHSAGLAPHQKEPASRPSDTCSLRSLPLHTEGHRDKREGRGLQMSDEEGEVFDNRWLKELSTPRRERPNRPSEVGNGTGTGTGTGAGRISELQWRNSLCPPHLKSSYPAETQFSHTLDEDAIKMKDLTISGRHQRKEVGITAYKKPGPPTPSKQAGRLSATDSELRESLRVETEPSVVRRTGTPSRIRAFFRSGRQDDNEVTPRRRLSNIFKRK